MCVLLTVLFVGAVAPGATAAAGQRLDLKVLLIGGSAGDPTTEAWSSELSREGVAYTFVRTAAGSVLPALTDPSDSTHGYYNGIILGTSSSSLGNLDSVYAYERTFGVRQVDGYEFPNAAVGLTYSAVVPTPFTAQVTAAGKGVFNYLAGPVPMDAGSYVYNAYEANPISNNFVRYLTEPSGLTIGGFYTHTGQDPAADNKAGVQEVVLTFNYNDQMTQFRLLSHGLITWVTRGVHLGYERNWLGNQVDDVLLSNSLWSTTLHCTPGETNPADPNCPLGTGGDVNAPEVRMTPADVTAVTAWEKNNIKLDLAFNGSGASSSDPLTTSLLSNKPFFGWVNHTWSHPYLGCQSYNPISAPAQPIIVADSSTGSLSSGSDYSYSVTALTAYGETTASATSTVTLASGATAANVSWAAVPLATGYHVYGRTPSGALGLIDSTTATRFVDDGTTPVGRAAPTTNTAGDPSLGCGTWVPTGTIVSEISKNQTFAKTNKLPAFTAASLVTGEHSGLDNPNMPAALLQTGISTVGDDASRFPAQRVVGPATTSPRYPSNIYYNVSAWAQLIDEYNTIYLPPGPNGTGGRCVNTSTTTCLSAPATKESILASETTIMLRHVLTNDPRLGYSHQSNLTGDRLILALLGNVLSHYRSWFSSNTPVVTPDLATTAAELSRQATWSQAVQSGQVTASVKDGVVTVVNSSSIKVQIPITVPTGTTLAGTTTAFGSSYGGELSTWQSMTVGASLALQLV